MTRVLLVGMAVADYVFYLKDFPTEATKYRADDAKVIGGGCAANAAVAIARLGGTPLLSARLGSDAVGESILSELRDEGVDVDLCDRSGSISAYSSILIDAAGERQIVNFRGRDLVETTDHFDSTQDISAVLADTRWTKGAVTAMELAKKRNVPGILDIEASDEPDSLYPASHLAFSLQGLESFVPDKTPAEAIAAAHEEFGGWVCVTMGAQGLLFHSDEGTGHVPSLPVEAVDTLGAGDCWHGAFALALGEGMNELEAAKFSNAVAALKCTRRGGPKGAPTRAETEQFLRERA
ncbi:PfkB family carbohydrate kinase [Actibacterium pelagium]|uniref:Sulfofructose kinase n=1 Tax=Actibacterium pelagium TaxID=2029103 RepID=A0A917ADC2_9RHOB|nr:PfkB family carbohydrate kinase [Actibacterium pelagium]GGE44556.1 sulfofructose kinase [Actibacterium pelagium]